MKQIVFVALALLFIVEQSTAQEEAVIAVKSRLEKSNSLHFNLGSANSLGQTNYRGGTLVGLGYQKRINRIVSIGVSITYASYRTDYADYMTGKYKDARWGNNLQPTNFYYTDSQAQYILVNLSGGNLNHVNISPVVKINFVPIMSNTLASFYGLVSPGLVVSTVGRVESNINFFDHPSIEEYKQVNNDSFESSAAQTKLTGGISISAGVEFFPTSLFSFYIQTGLGYSFPVPFVDTALYQKRVLEKDEFNPFDDYPLSADYPISHDKGFTTWNFQLGITYNF
ncbi:MAG: hypothetical protein C0490_13750 [Marivirga sp.]|nr:hypothetical protein [Marivirga sp.]